MKKLLLRKSKNRLELMIFDLVIKFWSHLNNYSKANALPPTNTKRFNHFFPILLIFFELNESYEVDGPICKCVFSRYTPACLSAVDESCSQVFLEIPTEGSGLSLQHSCVEKQ